MVDYDEFTSLLDPGQKKSHNRVLKNSKFIFFKTLTPFMFLQASVGICASLQATFYPAEAARKGASAAEYGAVFGIIHLSLFTFGPLVGKYLPIWGPRVLYPAGFILDGLSFIVFGLLHWVEDTSTFLVLSYLIRIIEGVGAAATWNTNLSILMARFPEQKASVKAWCDASFNLGLTLGPVLGAFMYEAGGFCLPFVVMGSCIILSGLAVYLVTEMPEIQRSETGSRSVLSFLGRPSISGALLTATMAAYTIGTIEATLATFLGIIPDMTVRRVAIVFLVMSLSSVVATPLAGWACDTRLSPWLVSSGGCLLMFLCFSLLGPAPYLSSLLSPSMTSVSLSLVAQGVGSAAVLVASFSCAQLAAVSHGLPAAADTQAVVAGLFTSAFAAGNFFGPTLSGVLYDAVGFSYNSLIIQSLLGLLFVLNIIFHVLDKKQQSSSSGA